MREQYLSVVLFLNKEDEGIVRACSEAVCASRQLVSRLDTVRMPHLTVARFEAPSEEASSLWGEVQGYRHMISTLISGGLCFSPYSDGDKTWAMLQFKRSNWLDELQRRVITGDFANRYPINNKIGEAYNPHCTLALLEGTVTPQVDLGKFPLFRREFSGFMLAVGINGPYQTIAEVPYK